MIARPTTSAPGTVSANEGQWSPDQPRALPALFPPLAKGGRGGRGRTACARLTLILLASKFEANLTLSPNAVHVVKCHLFPNSDSKLTCHNVLRNFNHLALFRFVRSISTKTLPRSVERRGVSIDRPAHPLGS